MSHYIPLKIDIVFKHLFTNDLVSLASLLSAILFPGGENKVIEISIISSEIIPLFQGGKRTFLDLKTIARFETMTNDDPFIQIELQVYEQIGYVDLFIMPQGSSRASLKQEILTSRSPLSSR